jgi:hypothetical protein
MSRREQGYGTGWERRRNRRWFLQLVARGVLDAALTTPDDRAMLPPSLRTHTLYRVWVSATAPPAVPVHFDVQHGRVYRQGQRQRGIGVSALCRTLGLDPAIIKQESL